MKDKNLVRAIVISCLILSGLVLLLPTRAPALNPMTVIVTTWYATTATIIGPVNLTFAFTFSNITTYVVSTSHTATTTIYIATFTTYTANVTVSTSATTTVTTASTTKTTGTTTIPSTTWTTVTATATGTTTGQTVTTTNTQTVTTYVTTSSTTTSIFTATGATPPTPPPIPGFPLESILAGLGLGLLGVHLVFRNRRANRKRPT